ncbi:MAG: hypothetical protein IKG18_00250 [Atopobiaceae bacterium]|nr:hypothetical protein [Atopobiaceae bacterium]
MRGQQLSPRESQSQRATHAQAHQTWASARGTPRIERRILRRLRSPCHTSRNA